MGDLHYFLGMEVNEIVDNLHLSQAKCIVDVLKRFKLNGMKPCKTPMSSTNSLSKDDRDFLENLYDYRSMVGVVQ
jgi:hypothetical protein